jgi:hypothetical protein
MNHLNSSTTAASQSLAADLFIHELEDRLELSSLAVELLKCLTDPPAPVTEG